MIETFLPGVKIFEPTVFADSRGFFQETWNAAIFRDFGLDLQFVQDNHSHSIQGTLRGLHYQNQKTQGRLVRVFQGAVTDVAVDLRRESPTFGQHLMTALSGENKRMVWIPPGFAHGFYVTSKSADFLYKTTDYYAPEFEKTLLWSDPALGIPWPIQDGERPILSKKDAQGHLLENLISLEAGRMI
jgi:dTDP-4-dehydrorhamnose 3,5-epimerase